MPRIDVPFVVELQSITQPTNANLVAGGQNYFYATFNLCETWKKISNIKAVFSRVDIEPIVVPLEQGADYMECKIPWEVMQTPGVFHVGVFGGDRLPTHYAYVRVKTGCVTEGDAPLPPTPDWFEIIEKEIGDISSALDELHIYAQSFSTGGDAE